jgi:hypothetical protein
MSGVHVWRMPDTMLVAFGRSPPPIRGDPCVLDPTDKTSERSICVVPSTVATRSAAQIRSCLETIEHLADDQGLVRWVVAMLAPEGQLLRTTPLEGHRPLLLEGAPSRVR